MIERDRIQVGTPTHELVLEALEAGITAAHPRTVLADSLALENSRLRIGPQQFDLSAYDDIRVLGGGNAAGRVASALEDILGSHLSGGIVVTDDPAPAGPVEMVEGNHPSPTETNIEGTRRLLEHARDCDEDTLAVVPVTGGGSALLAAPVDGVALSDLQQLTDELLRSGAPIAKINAVRKHVSSLKGGQLARELAPATTVGLVFSDVTSGDPSVVASGPLSPDSTTYATARAVLEEYDVDVPNSVTDRLRSGENGDAAETPNDDDPAFETVEVSVLADNFTALSAAADVCEREGLTVMILSSSVRGETQAAAKTHVGIAEEIRRTGNPVSPPAAIISGGETTVTITGDGIGGPNQEFALSAGLELPDDVVLGAVDTDGIDGPTDAAGALVSNETIESKPTARAFLLDNDAYTYLKERDALIITGHTGTNVNDLRVVLVPETAESSE
ncbi:DUF4147 domain-containing protein [Halostagnicola sp. A-GB9-2]|uniref:glycerate kinase type-2 family protein n=1 Tax=Halostagnicola sp. A-GB9-2 TaxID=3048066 RepID=UPI0024BF3493|nr:DUF4147 domain-containing protein [Halostagnicola sp. A-GB9-2]MDJ1433680.1 DUF4147 domain-containing protein [Halostagnicola sp. A-GB9-2]